jgi:uncharacterized protein YggT (Ycf19 family)
VVKGVPTTGKQKQLRQAHYQPGELDISYHILLMVLRLLENLMEGAQGLAELQVQLLMVQMARPE